MNTEYITLAELYDQVPDEEEMIWSFVGRRGYAEEDFDVVQINPVELANKSPASGQPSYMENYKENAKAWQRKLVQRYQKQLAKNPQLVDSKEFFLVISGNIVVDGNHRLIAMALNNITSAKAVSLED